jgi:hypothetical protein
MSTAINVAYPSGSDNSGKTQIRSAILTKLWTDSQWNTEYTLNGFAVNNQNKARILVGMAIHVAEDVYAHKAYEKVGTDWVAITGNAHQDSTKYVSSRYSSATGAAYDIVTVWHSNLTPDALEFHQSAHDGTVFKLYRFANYVCNSSQDVYHFYYNWYDNRSWGS